MKNDYTFKFVAAIIVAGVIVALVSPTHTTGAAAPVAEEIAPVTQATE